LFNLLSPFTVQYVLTLFVVSLLEEGKTKALLDAMDWDETDDERREMSEYAARRTYFGSVTGKRSRGGGANRFRFRVTPFWMSGLDSRGGGRKSQKGSDARCNGSDSSDAGAVVGGLTTSLEGDKSSSSISSELLPSSTILHLLSPHDIERMLKSSSSRPISSVQASPWTMLASNRISNDIRSSMKPSSSVSPLPNSNSSIPDQDALDDDIHTHYAAQRKRMTRSVASKHQTDMGMKKGRGNDYCDSLRRDLQKARLIPCYIYLHCFLIYFSNHVLSTYYCQALLHIHYSDITFDDYSTGLLHNYPE
jgi:hypothetical protein